MFGREGGYGGKEGGEWSFCRSGDDCGSYYVSYSVVGDVVCGVEWWLEGVLMVVMEEGWRW